MQREWESVCILVNRVHGNGSCYIIPTSPFLRMPQPTWGAGGAGRMRLQQNKEHCSTTIATVTWATHLVTQTMLSVRAHHSTVRRYHALVKTFSCELSPIHLRVFKPIRMFKLIVFIFCHAATTPLPYHNKTQDKNKLSTFPAGVQSGSPVM